jgi:hypothetical protein
VQTSPQLVTTGHNRALLEDYAKQLPLGSRVRAATRNQVVRGTLVKTTNTGIVVQPRARVAEPLVELPYGDLTSLEQEQPANNTGRAIAIGAGVGAAAALGMLLLLAAIFAGD